MSSSGTRREHFFTNRQVTTMVVALMVAVVMLPGAVWAVDTFTNVAIQDPVSGFKAMVTNQRALKVGDGSGAVTVDGSVTARPAPVADFRSHYLVAFGHSACHPLPAPPAGRAFVLQTLNFDVNRNPSPSGDLFQIVRGTTCAGTTVAIVTPPGIGLTTLPLDPGVVSTTGFSIRVVGEVVADVTATGYLVPSAGLPA